MSSQPAFGELPEPSIPVPDTSLELSPVDLVMPGTARVWSQFSLDVRLGLSAAPKTIPSMYLYDAVGSALFEAICHLDVYKCTTGETRLLSRHAREIAELLKGDLIVAELGGGSGRKASILLKELLKVRPSIEFHNIDVSTHFLQQSHSEVARNSRVAFVSHATTYQIGLAEVAQLRPQGIPILVLFLGSSIGNFDKIDAVEFMRHTRKRLQPGDHLLLGTDLIKPSDALHLAYDDPQGVTAAFNKNLLTRINQELGGNFDLKRFRHRVRWQEEAQCIEMHLVSDRAQTVSVPGAGITVQFGRGESILTEKSHKYLPNDIAHWCNIAGFKLVSQWVDQQSLFASNLLRAV